MIDTKCSGETSAWLRCSRQTGISGASAQQPSIRRAGVGNAGAGTMPDILQK